MHGGHMSVSPAGYPVHFFEHRAQSIASIDHGLNARPGVPVRMPKGGSSVDRRGSLPFWLDELGKPTVRQVRERQEVIELFFRVDNPVNG